MTKRTLKEIALEMGYSEDKLSPSGDTLQLHPLFGVLADDKGLHLIDLVSWARFAPIKIGRKSSVTRKGLEFQIGQLKVYLKQIGMVA